MTLETLPIIIEAETCERVLKSETELCDMAGSLLSQGFECPGLNDHLNAVVLANELLWAHEQDTPENEALHLAAEQLKAFHLTKIEEIIYPL